MTCDAARERFSELVDEVLTRAERADVYAHLATCPECRRELTAFERAVSMVRGMPSERAPIGFVDRVVAATRPAGWYARAARAARWPWPAKLPLGAAAMLLVAGLAVFLFRGSPEQRRASQPDTAPPAARPAPPPPRPAAPPARREPAPPAARTEPAPSVLADRTDGGKLAKERAETTDRPPSTDKDARLGASADRAASLRRQEPTSSAPREYRADEAKKSASPAERDTARAEPSAPPVAQSAPASQTSPLSTGTREQAAAEKMESLRTPDVVARLGTLDRETAERALVGLAARLGGAQTGRLGVGDALVLELAIPRDRYGDFKREIARLGDYRPESEPATLPDTVRIAVRLTP
jgi:hypothetical protein